MREMRCCDSSCCGFVSYNGSVSIIDFAFRMAYRAAYQIMRVYWRLVRPVTRGALVAIWNNGEILLVKNSYVNYYCVPGGYLKEAETPVEAAVRELAEEVSIQVPPEALKLGLEETHTWEGKTDMVSIFDLDVKERPLFRVDNREVVDAEFFSPHYALEIKLFPPLRRHLEARLAKQA
jgi:8-oxo-dGTP diphosphatase